MDESPREFVRAMESLKGLPYVWGAKGPSAYDCSGAVSYGASAVGAEVPHGSANQIDYCKAVSVETALRTEGALLYMPGHIAASKGDNATTIEARNPSVGIGNFSSKNRGWTRAGLIPNIHFNPNKESVMARTPAQITSAATALIGKSGWSGLCEKFVRTSFGFPARYASANLAYKASAKAGKIHTDTNPPAGVPVFWDIRSGVNTAYDHVAVSVGGGYCISTSVGPGRTPARIKITTLTTLWGMKYLGWAEWYHGKRVYTPPKVVTPSAPKVSAPANEWPNKDLVVDKSFGTTSYKAYQRLLKVLGFYKGNIDGSFGSLSVKAEQSWLKSLGFYKGSIDGFRGPGTIDALLSMLKKAGFYTGAMDKKFGPLGAGALQRYINSKASLYR